MAETRTCPVCASQQVDLFLEIEQVPVFCNVLWPTRKEALEAGRGDLRLGFCETCGHIFNYAFNPDLLAYNQAYENSLHFSPRFQQYVEALADRLISTYNLRGKRAIDVGCGKGDFLELLCAKGVGEGIGFDPSYEERLAPEQDAERITIIQDLYSPKYAGYQADLVSCRHVLEHIQEPRRFMKAIRQAIGEAADTVVFFEVPNTLFTLRELAIWDLIYEHCSYFSPPSLTYLFNDCGFEVQDISDAFAGQYLTLEAFPRNVAPSDGSAVTLDGLKHEVATFARRYEEKVTAWERKLKEAERKEQRVVIWGAGSKGVTILNILAVRDQVEYAVDINPRKQGKHIAGTGQKIVPPEFLRAYKPDVVILMNAIYEDEVRQAISALGLSAELVTA